MKIRIVMTMNIDADAWVENFGIAMDKVREDVQTYAINTVREQFISIDVLKAESA